MALNYNNNIIGTYTLVEGKNKFQIEMRECNALTCNIYVYYEGNTRMHQLVSFLVDEQHCKNIMKTHKDIFMNAKIEDLELNTYFKQTHTLIKYLIKSKREFSCYYIEPNKS